ncbi:MAG: YbhB/YbcL family Raf kinase inhibitor-like protein [Candidatus Magasanikbacteria bacterium CG_4_9_14_0_2_um_filter_41_10]|uniref:YbhB/YbcL family Raf kinase inhibitor-like protein n=1 Tax=Candidatus Magasanikbacteria bacterium CG_4_10_14_0_2_um_filter_41_31 TaxID=1974639 RepID=A0A2M7V585_9BACT|nr:MAG: kinase inhibitor [Candidatus Magasanikbacteria bacterium CG1_02_41_34]PIZ93736.1 MAG: YbhB/YbcL family Raf kinase inhibitor-like protein [Candidatus Magasanikbacteria bacterium CG_4_10_14_0_2_um_filter_41_31]PJC53724.1 MAG: YbhB/YbcL family Raf kinase inhibitor-like protein [Candidatus Magasanikbacteria bacterium CG_4_9_14_0_2_um_filter_41_10]
MKLTSSAFFNEMCIPAIYTCDGQDISPPLTISDVPSEAKSLALIMDDPDAMKPTGNVWNHWLVWNIDPTTVHISEGEEPVGTHGTGTGGETIYHGPCPPDAEHRYSFRLYALDTMLDLQEGSTKGELEQAMDGHILAQVELAGTYNRKIK